MSTSHNQTLQNLNQILTLYHQVQDKISTLDTEIARLEAQERVHGHIWMKNGQYMYLVHKADGHKEYIGADPEKQAEATARLQRYAEWTDKQRERHTWQKRLREAEDNITHAHRVLQGKYNY